MQKYLFVGDIHGCREEFEQLLAKNDGRTIIVLGDWSDRGPDSLGVLRILVNGIKENKIKIVRGNHCNKLYRWAKGNIVSTGGGIKTTIEEISKLSPDEQKMIKKDIIYVYEKGSNYLLLDNNKIVAVHGGWREDILTNVKITNKEIESVCIYANVINEKGSDGFPVDWIESYNGKRIIIYGHIVHNLNNPYNVGNAYCLDTGCVHGGNLTGMMYPEMEYIQIKALKKYH